MSELFRPKDLVMDVMTSTVFTIKPSATIQDASKVMESKKIGSIVVTLPEKKRFFKKSGEQIVGIITDTDIVRKAISKNIRPSKVLVQEIMSRPVKTIPHSFPLVTALKMLSENKIKRIPVLEGEKLAGVITVTDLLIAMTQQGKLNVVGKFIQQKNKNSSDIIMINEFLKAKNWMVSPVQTISHKSTLLDAASLMAEKGFGCIPITDDNGLLVGIITDTDLVRKAATQDLDMQQSMLQEFMTKNPVTTDPESSIIDICKLMIAHKFKRLPVVDEKQIVGLLSVVDILNILVRLNDSANLEGILAMMKEGRGT